LSPAKIKTENFIVLRITIQATAEQGGYLSASAFSYALKNKLEISPSELQK
jgi:AraC-like DNA-binding protein